MPQQAFFYPWNPLSLSRNIDSGRPCERGLVKLPLYELRNGRFYWNAVVDSSLVLFTQEHADVTELCFNTSRGFSKRDMFHTAEARFYDFHDRYTELDEFQNSDFSRVPYKANFKNFLQEFIKFREAVNKDTTKAGLLEPYNKKHQVLIVPMGPEEMEVFRGSQAVQKAFVNILQHSQTARMYPWFVMDDPSQFSPAFCKAFTTGLYLGTKNAQFAHDVVYPDSRLSYYRTTREVIGVGVRPQSNILYRLHHMTRSDTSEWGKVVREYSRNNEVAYRAFLDSLEE